MKCDSMAFLSQFPLHIKTTFAHGFCERKKCPDQGPAVRFTDLQSEPPFFILQGYRASLEAVVFSHVRGMLQ